MSTNYIELSSANESSQDSGEAVFQYSGTVASGTTGKAIILPTGAGKINVWNVAIILTAGQSGKIQYTISTRASIIAGTANWHDTASGTVTATDKTALENVSAVRAVSIAGNITLEVRAS